MKHRARMFVVIGLLFALFVAVSVGAFLRATQTITEGYCDSEGSTAQSLAEMAAASIQLTDARVEELKAMDFAEVKTSAENEAFCTMLTGDILTRTVDYAYVMLLLRPDEVRYKVDEESASYFNAPVGTPLDIMFLLDVEVSAEAKARADAFNLEHDLQRYAYYIEEDAKILSAASMWMEYSSEWGRHFCGYAPLYTVEGTYIGAVGIDMQANDLDQYISLAMNDIGLVLVGSVVTLIVLFVYLYIKYRQFQFEKIYTDSLTRIRNRSYYNDQYLRHINGMRGYHEVFALMIADIDLFKNVNDTFGHNVGDEVLADVAALLEGFFGRGQVIRFGGEEFVMGVWIDDPATLQPKLDALFEKIADTRFSKQHLTISLSLGCSWCRCTDVNGWRISGMLCDADEGLYEAKENGRKQYRIRHCDTREDD